VEALNTTTIRRLTRSRRHQLLAIAPSDLKRDTDALVLLDQSKSQVHAGADPGR
jgi:hypothetical protein